VAMTRLRNPRRKAPAPKTYRPRRMNNDEYDIDESVFLLGFDDVKSEVPSEACRGQAPSPC